MAHMPRHSFYSTPDLERFLDENAGAELVAVTYPREGILSRLLAPRPSSAARVAARAIAPVRERREALEKTGSLGTATPRFATAGAS